MKYLLLTLLCSVSMAHSMEDEPFLQTAGDESPLQAIEKQLLKKEIKKEKRHITLRLSAISQQMLTRTDSIELCKVLEKLQNRLIAVDEILTWIKEAEPTNKGISQAFTAYKNTYSGLTVMPPKAKKPNVHLEQQQPMPTEFTPALLAQPLNTRSFSLSSITEESDEELVEQGPARSQSAAAPSTASEIEFTTRRSSSAPLRRHSSPSTTIASTGSLESIPEDVEAEEAENELFKLFKRF